MRVVPVLLLHRRRQRRKTEDSGRTTGKVLTRSRGAITTRRLMEGEMAGQDALLFFEGGREEPATGTPPTKEREGQLPSTTNRVVLNQASVQLLLYSSYYKIGIF